MYVQMSVLVVEIYMCGRVKVWTSGVRWTFMRVKCMDIPSLMDRLGNGLVSCRKWDVGNSIRGREVMAQV